MNKKTYDALKYFSLIACPAIAAFIGITGATWGLSIVDELVLTVNATAVLLGALTAAESRQHAKHLREDEELNNLVEQAKAEQESS